MIENVFVVTTTEGTMVPKVFRESCKAAQEVFNIACELREKGYIEVHHFPLWSRLIHDYYEKAWHS